MKIACLSGKGGAGKTFVAVHLAVARAQGGNPCTYLDCDVEEPNGHLFFQPKMVETHAVTKLLPVFDSEKCVGCKTCVNACRFHALIYIKGAPMLFPEVCHSCGGCALVCKSGAVGEVPQEIGTVDVGHWGAVTVVTGTLRPGEASGVGVIRGALAFAGETTVVDCPPGSACSVMESVMDGEYCVLVAEPTAFGLHNLEMVYELVTLLGKPCGVVINKETQPYPPLEVFCQEKQLPILARIPYDTVLAGRLAQGKLLADDPALLAQFQDIWAQIEGGCL